MIIFHAVGEAAQAWNFAVRGLGRSQTREPFFLVGGLQLILLIALGNFHTPALAGFLTPIVRVLGGEAALHYPDHFWALPEIYRNANTVLGVLFTFIAWGVATLRFAGRHGSWREGFRLAPSLVAVGVFAAGAPWLITSLFNLIPAEISLRSFVIRIGLQGIELFLIVLLQSAVAYAIAFIVLRRESFAAAIVNSVGLFRRTWLSTFLLIAIPAAALFPPTFFMFEMNMDEKGLAPEGAGMLLMVLIVLRLFFDILVVGGLTSMFLSREGDRS